MNQENVNQLVAWIKDNKNYSMDQLKQSAIQGGHNEEDFNAALSILNSPNGNQFVNSSPSNENNVYATFPRRFVAYLIDISIMALLSDLLTSYIVAPIISPWITNVFNTAVNSGPDITSSGATSIFSNMFKIWGAVMGVGLLISFIIYFIYYVFFNSSKLQATPGKIVLGLLVTDKSGGKINFLRSLGRTAASIISSVILYIGYLFPLFTAKKQTLHDIIASTVVVDVKKRTKLFVFLCFIGLIIISIVYGNLNKSPESAIRNQIKVDISRRPALTLSNAQKEEIKLAVAELHNIVKMNSIIEMRKYLVSSADNQLSKTNMESSTDSYVKSTISEYSVILETVNEDTLMSPNIFWMPFFDNITKEPIQVMLTDKSAEIKGKMIRLSFTKINGVWKSQRVY